MTEPIILLQTTIGIVGAGAMGAGIGQVAAAAGHSVRLFDTRIDATSQAIQEISAAFLKLVAKPRSYLFELTAFWCLKRMSTYHCLYSLGTFKWYLASISS